MVEKIKTKEEKYNEYVKQVTPTHNVFVNMLKAFLVGGIICLIAQFIMNFLMAQDLKKDDASSWVMIIMILLSVILTGLNIYPRIAKFGGAGCLVPITGFANSVVAPAIEYKKEGQIFGIGCKIFTIAGPVILYGILSSWIVGIIYYIISLL
jgi:stage V sporulation protein AC